MSKVSGERGQFTFDIHADPIPIQKSPRGEGVAEVLESRAMADPSCRAGARRPTTTDIGVQAQRDELRRRAARSARVAELTAGQETPMAMSEAEKRELSAAKGRGGGATSLPDPARSRRPVGGIEAERISKEENAAKRSVLAAQAQKDLTRKSPRRRTSSRKAGATPAETPAGDPVAVRQPPEAGRKADRRSVHQAKETSARIC